MHVSPQLFRVLAEALTLSGIDPHPWMLRAGLPHIDTMGLAPWRSVDELDTMMDVTRQASADAGFGLVVATSLAQARHGALVPVTMSAPTLRAALDDICQYARLLQRGSEMSYAVSGPQCAIRFEPLGTTAAGRRARAEQIMGGMLMLLRYSGVWEARVHHIHFAHPRPEYGARYARVFGPSVKFDQPRCEIAIDASLLDTAHATRDPGLYALAKARANAQLGEIESAESVAAAVRRMLCQCGDHLPGMKEAAQQLGLSERTLRRRLDADGVSFLQLVADHRRSKVETLLMRGDTPLKQIAAGLGYASISSFHRAFRQQTGLTPLQWRRRHLATLLSPAA